MFQNSYKKLYTPSDKVVKLSRTYTMIKSFPLTRTVINISNQASESDSPFVAVFYQAPATAEKDEVSCHGSATQTSKPYFLMCKDVLQKSTGKCVNGLNTKNVYNETNKESGGVYYRSSQSSELQDRRQVHRQKEKAKKCKGMSASELLGELSTAIMLQRSDLEFIKAISCIRDSYYIFLGTTISFMNKEGEMDSKHCPRYIHFKAECLKE